MNRDPRFALSQEVEAKQTLLVHNVKRPTPVSRFASAFPAI